jgi:hypothetical protein
VSTIFESSGEMFEGDIADMCTKKKSAGVNGGPSRGSSVRRLGSQDPWHQNTHTHIHAGQNEDEHPRVSAVPESKEILDSI